MCSDPQSARNEMLWRGADLFNGGEFHEAHEVWEEVWRDAERTERYFFQSLVHVAVGCYHWERDNRMGAVLQWSKGVKKLAGYLPVWRGINTSALYAKAEACLEKAKAGSGCQEPPRIEAVADDGAGR